MAAPGPAEKRRVSPALVVAVALVVVLAGLLAYTVSTRAPVGPGPGTQQVTYDIGLAIAITGTAYVAEGPIRRQGALLAIEQMNATLAATGSNIRFRPVPEDTGGTPEGADRVLRNFAAAGIQVVVGPLSSGETSQVRQFVTERKIVTISPSATAISLSIPNDYVFRMPPTDDLQARALAQLVDRLGYSKVAIMARQDDYGRGLSDLFEQRFETTYGGQVSRVLYSPDAQDLSGEVGQLSQNVQEFGGGDDTAVLAIAFSAQAIEIFEEAKEHVPLRSVRWFGAESLKRGLFVDPAQASSDVRDFLSNGTQMTGFFPGAEGPVADAFQQAYLARWGTNPVASPYAYYAYDATWLAMQSVLTAGKYDGEAIAKALPRLAEKYLGASGYKALNVNGDVVGADYRAWRYSFDSTTNAHRFVDIGVWLWVTEELELFP